MRKRTRILVGEKGDVTLKVILITARAVESSHVGFRKKVWEQEEISST